LFLNHLLIRYYFRVVLEKVERKDLIIRSNKKKKIKARNQRNISPKNKYLISCLLCQQKQEREREREREREKKREEKDSSEFFISN
jgi:hypothetical protein